MNAAGEKPHGRLARAAAAEDLARAGGRDAPVEIVPYDPSWPERFAAERDRIAPLLGRSEIHHIGSTAVPGLAAKPIVDLMALVEDLDAPIPALVEHGGYRYPEAFNAALSGRRWLCRPSAAHRTHHLHLVSDPQELRRHLRFRDRLRADPSLAAEYADLKRDLAERHRDDREAYSAAKEAFVRGVEPAAEADYCRPVVLSGRRLRLELLDERHVVDLTEAAQDDEVWRWMPAPRPRDDRAMRALVRAAREEWERGVRLPFAIVDQASGRVIGSTSYMDIAPEHRALEIGWTWLGRRWWRTAHNTEAKLLMLRHAFEELGVNRVALRTDHRNERSQAAIARIGGVREGSLRQHRKRPDGSFRDTVYYSILAEEWPAVERRLVERLAAGAFADVDRALDLRAERSDAPDAMALLRAFATETVEKYPETRASTAGWLRGDAGLGPSATPDELAPPGGRFLVAYCGGRAVGCGGLKRIDESTGEVKRLYVAAEARGEGVGRELLAALEDAAREAGYSAVRLDTGKEQRQAIALFRSSGYREIPDYNGNPYASFWFEKRLWDRVVDDGAREAAERLRRLRSD